MAATSGSAQKSCRSEGTISEAVSDALSLSTGQRQHQTLQTRDLINESATTRSFDRRRKLWEMDSGFHCSLLGICLGIDEMRRLASRLGVAVSDRVSDYQIHHQLLQVANSSDKPGRRLHRYLDDRYAGYLKAWRSLSTEDDLRRLWNRSYQEFDLPGNYWALLTHPSLTHKLANEVAEEVHMLSHVSMGVVHRIRLEVARLEGLLEKSERALKRERLARKQDADHLQSVNSQLAHTQHEVRRQLATMSEEQARRSQKAIDELNEKHRVVTSRLKFEIECADKQAQDWRVLYRKLSGQLKSQNQESTPFPEPQDSAQVQSIDLHGRRVAYVGGRERVIPRIRDFVETSNGRFVHHDGGQQERAGRVDDCVGQSDILAIPLDCVSHDACRRLKRECRRLGKAVLWLHTASTSAFENALIEFLKNETSVITIHQSGRGA